jgi:hypothetical protein
MGITAKRERNSIIILFTFNLTNSEALIILLFTNGEEEGVGAGTM